MGKKKVKRSPSKGGKMKSKRVLVVVALVLAFGVVGAIYLISSIGSNNSSREKTEAQLSQRKSTTYQELE